MPIASEIEPVSPGVSIWRSYDPSVKADLFSTALETASGTYLIDPIPLAPEAVTSLAAQVKVAGIIVTNENHERAAAQFSEKFAVPIYMSPALLSERQFPSTAPVQDKRFPAALTAVEIEGGPAGEIAIHFAGGYGTMVVGDALINFEPYGFALLPAKYCSNFKAMRRSLSKLLDCSFDRMLFAHGMPILSRARERLEQLLKEHL
jgi:glyoxylase-like metal-dependent hydrolase (beta-lactamase superfamily II)